MKRVENVLLFLALLFLPTQLGRHFWPQFAYVYSLPIDYLSPTIYFWDLLVVFLVLMFLLKKRKVNRIALNLWMLFLLSQLLSLLPHLDYPFNLVYGLVRIEQYIVAGLFGVYLASVNLNKIRSVLFWSIGLSILGESILAILQFLKGQTLGFWIFGERTFSLSTPAIAKFDFQGLEFLRPYATFPHPNVLAAFLVVTLPLLSLLRPQADRIYMIALSVIFGGITLVLTVSRVAFVVGLVEVALFIKKKFLIFLIFILIFLSPFLYTRFSTLFTFDNLSFLRREELTEVAWKLWLSNQFLGVGLNNFIPKAADEILVGPSRFLQPVHNIFLLSLAETGLIGLTGLLILIGFPIVRLFKLLTANYQLRTLLLIWGVIIFLGLFDHYFVTLPQGYRILFLVWGISLSRFA